MSETEFFLEQIDAEVTFEANQAVEVARLVIHQAGQEIPAERISDSPDAEGSRDE